MARVLTEVISVRMTPEQYGALEREARRKGARVPDLVRWFASDLLVLEKKKLHQTLLPPVPEYESVEDIPPDEYRRLLDGKWGSPDGEVEKSLRRLNAEDWAAWSERRLGE